MSELTLVEADLRDPSQRKFILDGWLKSFKKSAYSGVIPNNRYTEVMTDTILQLLSRGMTILLLKGVEIDVFLGFVAFEEAEIPVLHYIYVKPDFRGEKFGKKLALAAGLRPSEPFLYTFRTRDSRKFPDGVHCKALACRKNLEPITRTKPNGN